MGLCASAALRREEAEVAEVAGQEDALVEQEDAPKPQRPSMPARWLRVHDCERPARWRESYDDEDCRILALLGSADEAAAAATVAARRAEMQAAKEQRSREYKQLVPSIVTVQDFLQANDQANQQGKILVVKVCARPPRAPSRRR